MYLDVAGPLYECLSLDPRAKGEPALIWSPLAERDRFIRCGPYPDDVTPEKDDCLLGPWGFLVLMSPLLC